MKAVLLTKYGVSNDSFEIKEIKSPTLKEGHVIISVEVFGLNYADVMARKGLYKAAPPLPAVLGYEVVGLVKEVYSKADNILLGKRVVSMTRFGGYAQEVCVPVESLVVLPESILY